jgi:hypothetical protein
MASSLPISCVDGAMNCSSLCSAPRLRPQQVGLSSKLVLERTGPAAGPLVVAGAVAGAGGTRHAAWNASMASSSPAAPVVVQRPAPSSVPPCRSHRAAARSSSCRPGHVRRVLERRVERGFAPLRNCERTCARRSRLHRLRPHASWSEMEHANFRSSGLLRKSKSTTCAPQPKASKVGCAQNTFGTRADV